LPLWLIALLVKNAFIALDYIALFVRKFWSDPPKHRVRYYEESAPRALDKDARMTIKRGSGERYFEA